MRKTKKFDYTCSENEDNPDYLNLTCEEAKILKYLLKINLNLKNKKINFIQNNILKKELINNYLNKVYNTCKIFLDIISDVIFEKKKISKNFTNINEKYFAVLDIIDSDSSNYKPAISKAEKYSKIIGKSLFVAANIAASGALIMTGVGTFLGVPLLYLGTKNIGNSIKKTSEKRTITNEAKSVKDISKFKNMNLDSLYDLFNIFYYVGIITRDINKIISNKKNDINIMNICVNGKNVKGKRVHVKCNNKDYKDIKNLSFIKEVLKKLDLDIDKISVEDLKNDTSV